MIDQSLLGVRNLIPLIIAIGCLTLVWVFVITNSKSNLPKRVIITVRSSALFLFGLACILLIQLYTNRIDPRLFQNADCHVACWNDLIMGKTTVDAMQASMEKELSSFKELDNSYRSWEHPGERIFEGYTREGMRVDIDTLNGIIHRIELQADTFSLSLKEIISHLGSTQYVHLLYETVLVYRLGTAQATEGWAIFYYPSAGYVFRVPLSAHLIGDKVKLCVQQDQLVNRIDVVAVGSIDELLGSLPYSGNLELSSSYQTYMLSTLKPLQDFGCFDLPYPPEQFTIQAW
jgi:hypothetical protein